LDQDGTYFREVIFGFSQYFNGTGKTTDKLRKTA